MYRSKLARGLALTLLTLAAAVHPGSAQAQTAPCPQIEPYLSVSSIGGVPTSGALGQPDQVTISLGTCITLRLVVVRQSGSTISTQDVTTDPNTLFFTDPSRGIFSGPKGSVWCPTRAECNREFPIYGQYTDPCTHTIQRDTVHVHVNPCPPTALLSISGCPGTPTVVNETGCTGTFPSGATIPVATGGSGTITTTFNVTGATTATGLTLAQLQALTFNVGTSTITEVATAGTETVSCTFLRIVVTRPTLTVTCPATQNLTGSAANCTATLSSGLTFPTTGACGAVTLSFGVSGATTASHLTLAQLLALAFHAGTSTVTVTATSAGGQTATCSFNVVVTPPAPTITCPPSFTVCVPAGTCTATGVIISPTVTPPCATTTTIVATLPGGGTVTAPAGTPLTLPFGLTTIIATATNVSGTASCMTTVLVLPLGQIEIKATVVGVTGEIGTHTADQVTIHVGGTITIAVTISTPGCPPFSAVQAGLASFGVGTNLIVGSFSGNVFTAGLGAANRQFPIYARFFNSCTGLTYTTTIHVTVRP